MSIPRNTLSISAFAALMYFLPACVGNAPNAGSDVAAGGNTLSASTDPGSIALHRLNRAEYNNTVRDLLATAQQPANQLPADGQSAGFDNVADALVIDPSMPALYEAAAESLAAEAVNPNSQAYKIVAACDVTAGASVIDSCLVADVGALASRAWRRPATQAEISAVVAAAQVGKTPSDRLQLAVTAILVSPYFIFRVELDADPTSLTPHPLSDHELASRLSYFVWSSMPDQALMAAANANTLHNPAVLNAQLTRMLADVKAQGLVQNFGGQWLDQRAAQVAQPDRGVYPSYSATVLTGMLTESSLYLNDFLFGRQPVTSILTANYTYLNDSLAAYYGLTPPNSPAFVKVILPAESKRLGLLTQGSVLLAGSHSNQTSPVNRGRFVLQQLLCSDPPPPPANVVAAIPKSATGTLRQQLEAHLTTPACASCHISMDPIGFALEEFDGVGQFRSTDNGLPVDTQGSLHGAVFTDAPSMASVVSQDPRFQPCVEKMLFTYALGRAPTPADTATLTAIHAEVAANTNSFVDIITSIVNSPAFLLRRANQGQ